MRDLSLDLLKDLNMLLALFFVALNILSFFLIKFDKKRAIQHQWRVPERSLFVLAFAGGAVGTYLGMIFFRHKTKQFLFTRGIAALMALNVIIFYFVFR
ncbi:MAG: DUF1294 domain-containing protein [Dethiobacter sp.]|nr:MAG: DUF1294 domain-containing protein [Dethiobacter sp.]